jgi:hypothetical protein
MATVEQETLDLGRFQRARIDSREGRSKRPEEVRVEIGPAQRNQRGSSRPPGVDVTPASRSLAASLRPLLSITGRTPRIKRQHFGTARNFSIFRCEFMFANVVYYL